MKCIGTNAESDKSGKNKVKNKVKSISGVGPALVDKICKIDRYPERGGQAVVRESIKQAGGAAANTIFGLANFGNSCRFYTTLGNDADADFFKSSLERVGVEVKALITHPETGRVDIYVDSEGERTFFVHPNASSKVSKLPLKLEDEDYRSTNVFYLDPFPSKESFSVHTSIAKKAKEFGCKVVLNPGYPYSSLGFDKLKELLKWIDVVIMSKPEFERLGGNAKIFLDYVNLLVVTLSEMGSKAFSKDKVAYVPAFKVERVVDTTGAGDAFAAGFIHAMLLGYSIEDCLKVGNYVASYNIQHYGARNFPDWSDVEAII